MFDLWKKVEKYGIRFGLQRCYFADDGDGAGGSGGDKGDAGDGDKGDGDKGDKGDGGGKKEPDTFEVKIGGETKLLTLDELKTHAEKAGGADKLMREAAELRKGGVEGVEIKEAFQKVLNSDSVEAADIRKLATVMGVNPDEMEKMFKEELEKQGRTKDVKVGEKVGRDQLDEETRNILDQVKVTQIKEAEKEIRRICDETVDKDEMFGKMIDEVPKEQRTGKVDSIKRMVFRDVRGKILASPESGEKFGTEMIQSSIQGIRKDLKDFGIPSKSSKKTTAVQNLLAALGPTGGLPAEVQSDEKIERVSSTEANYEDNVVKRLGQKLVQAVTNKSKQ